jgi:hypothetical protein
VVGGECDLLGYYANSIAHLVDDDAGGLPA